jgi:triacylglycerol lipase
VLPSGPVFRSIQWIAIAFGLAIAACGEQVTPNDPPSAQDAGVDAAITDLGATEDAGLDAGALDRGTHDIGIVEDTGVTIPDATIPDANATREPVVFIHGIGGSSAEFQVLKDRLVVDGWAADRLYTIDFEDPRWDCNVDNAEVIRMTVASVRAETGAARIDLVAHSMGTLSSRYYLQHLGGLDEVASYVTLGGLHHGNRSACLNPLPVCVWQELCPTKPYLTDLNMEPVDLGIVHWVSICSRTDETAGLDTCHFDPVTNVEVDGVDHAGTNGLLEHPDVYPEIVHALEYPVP